MTDSVEARCSCGSHAMVLGEVPDPGCPLHGDHGINAWTTCQACGKLWRHAVGHTCEAVETSTARQWLTVVAPETDVVHVVPKGDTVMHLFDGCACGPTTEPIERGDGSMGWLETHHSLDGREANE